MPLHSSPENSKKAVRWSQWSGQTSRSLHSLFSRLPVFLPICWRRDSTDPMPCQFSRFIRPQIRRWRYYRPGQEPLKLCSDNLQHKPLSSLTIIYSEVQWRVNECTEGIVILEGNTNEILLFPPKIELRTFSVLGRRDNRYTMETSLTYQLANITV